MIRSEYKKHYRFITIVHIILRLPRGEQKRQNPSREALARSVGDLGDALDINSIC
jgi:hypothetical protein